MRELSLESALALLRRLRGSLRTSAFERDMAAELDFHVERETQALVERGMDPRDARREARRRFGSVALARDGCRDSWGLRAVDAAAQDARYAARMLAKHPGYTAAVVLTLALGIGANTAIFSVVHAVLLRSLPYAAGDRLVEVQQLAGGTPILLSAREMDDYRAQSASLDGLVEYHQMRFNLLDALDLRSGDQASRVITGVVSPQFFDLLGVKPMLGRGFTADDDKPGAPAVLILSYAYWQRALGGDPHVVGRAFQMNDRAHTVVGVLPPVPQYPENNDVYMPVSACPFRSSPHMESDRRMRMVQAIGRVKAGITIEAARSELALIAGRLAERYPDAYDAAAGFTTTARSVREQLTARARPTLLLLLATTGFVLLVVCANVANLMLARLAGRERELVLRRALGAGRARIARQLLTESTMLALAGGVLGVLFAVFTRDLLVAFTARFTLRASEISVDTTVLLFALAVSVATGVAFGAVPVAGKAKPGRHGVRHALVVAQVAIVFVLLIGAGLMVRSFVKLRSVDAGFDARRVLTARVDLDWIKYDTDDRRRGYFHPLLDRLRAEPGVEAAALSLTFPLNESAPFNQAFLVEGEPRSARPGPLADFRLASPDYFRAIGMTLLRGRAFTSADDAKARPVAIVNLSMARHHFGDADPIGRRVSLDNGRTWRMIVGLVNDVRQYGLASAPIDELYVPFDQRAPLGATLLVRTTGDPLAIERAVRRIARDVDPQQPISRVETLEAVRASSLDSPRLTTLLVSLFAAVALVITAAGIAGVASFSVTQRAVEIGVRMALGAPRASVVRMVVGQGLVPVAAGLAVGLGAALLCTRAVVRLLFAVEPTDPPTYAAVIATLVAVAALSCLAPARRAAAIEPAVTLRAE